MDQVWGCGMTTLKYEEDKQMEGNLDTPHSSQRKLPVSFRLYYEINCYESIYMNLDTMNLYETRY